MRCVTFCMYLLDEWPTSCRCLRTISNCEFLADRLAFMTSSFSWASEALAREIRSFTAVCMTLYSSASASLTWRRVMASLATITFALRCSLRPTCCRSFASRSSPACCSACALASTIEAFAARNWRFTAISFSSFFSRISSCSFSFFFCWIRSATSTVHCSRYCFCASATSIFLCLMAACFACDSDLERSRIFASVSAFSFSSCCFSTLFSSCRWRLSSTSLACWSTTILRRSCSSA
mmetsp:Transcript_17182/g.51456  ORF Transcript_17182/g.51456 Transcript_17182/m.51456 type:complete len:237 (-) Transcript_17182:1731-2441(-)